MALIISANVLVQASTATILQLAVARAKASAASWFPGSVKDEGAGDGAPLAAAAKPKSGEWKASATWCVTLLLWNLGKHLPVWF